MYGPHMRMGNPAATYRYEHYDPMRTRALGA
jgi:hypothetical protein